MRRKTALKQVQAKAKAVKKPLPHNPGTVLCKGRRPVLPAAPATTAGPQPAVVNVALTADSTPAQREVAEVGACVETLLRQPRFAQLRDALVTVRRANAALVRHLYALLDHVSEGEDRQLEADDPVPVGEDRQRCETRVPEGEDRRQSASPHPLAADFLVQYAAWLALKPFSEHELMNGLRDHLLPCLADLVDSHTEADEADRAADLKEALAARRQRPVASGLAWSPHGTATVERDRSLVLAGPAAAVLWLLDHVVAAALADNNCVVRFALAARPEDAHALLVRVGGAAWKGCCATPRRLAKAMGASVAERLTYSPDVVVCDDLSLALTHTLVGRAAGAVAGDAHRVLRKWCDGTGAALVAAVPLDGAGVPDLGTPEFEQLRTFADLVPVWAEPAPAADRLLVRAGACASFEADRAAVEAHGRRALLTTGPSLVT